MAGWEWDPEIRSWNNEPRNIVDYMKSENQVPIMTQSDSVLQFGPNAYAKPAAALNDPARDGLGPRAVRLRVPRVLPPLDVQAAPRPADFFRTMEDASGVDLDWFWRGWFYTTDMPILPDSPTPTGKPNASTSRQRSGVAE